MKIQVILGSTRPTRITERLAKWAVLEAEKIEGVEVELVDLADYPMPFLDEAISPRYNPNRTPNEPAQRFLSKLAEADGYVIATAEYNHSIPGVLKNALDYIDFQIAKKPVAIFSHGTVGGARAAEQLKLILIEAGSAVVPKALAIHGASELLDVDGHYIGDTGNPYGPDKLAQTVLQDLVWWTHALNAARKEPAAV